MLVPFDLLATAIAMVVMILIGMRLLYGAWPWEAHKTWYHTREPMEYVVAMQRARRALAARQIGSSETSNTSTAGSPSMQGDCSKDSLDHSLLAADDSPVITEVGAGLAAAFGKVHD